MTDPIHMQYGIESVKKIVALLILCSAGAFAKTAYVTDDSRSPCAVESPRRTASFACCRPANA